MGVASSADFFGDAKNSYDSDAESNRTKQLQEGQHFRLVESLRKTESLDIFAKLSPDSGQLSWKEVNSSGKPRTGTISMLLLDRISAGSDNKIILWGLGGFEKLCVIEAESESIKDTWTRGLEEALYRYKGNDIFIAPTRGPSNASTVNTSQTGSSDDSRFLCCEKFQGKQREKKKLSSTDKRTRMLKGQL